MAEIEVDLPTSNVIDFLPQRFPMLMIERLESADENSCTTSFCIEHRNLFVEDGVFKEPGLIENIAQTAAAQIGFLSLMRGQLVPIGYIAAIRRLVILRHPLVSTEIKTFVKRLDKIGNIILLEGKTSIEGQVICSCELRVYIDD
ncbi:MAG: 3-hydroxyacyl-ACP dehydratase [Cyclobacteriaceae bacterium]